MDSKKLQIEELRNLKIDRLGDVRFPSHLKKDDTLFVDDSQRIEVYPHLKDNQPFWEKNQMPPSFEQAGPRQHLYFDPGETICGIVTCGGLCPGLNDVIRTISLSLLWQYNVSKVLGFRFGYQGLARNPYMPPLEITPEVVDEIQHEGGSILGSSRGDIPEKEIVDTLEKYNIRVLFAIGGDGTFRGAYAIHEEIKRRKRPIAIIGIPKTIDNDIYCSQKTFGFETAVGKAREAIAVAHNEAKSAYNGIGLVKLMGRDSGFIAAYATLANSDVNFCFIPEVCFRLKGEDGFLHLLEKRLQRKRHAVIVVAEGAGQSLIDSDEPAERDASGNVQHKDVGAFLKKQILGHFEKKDIPITLKYIDPSYMIRSTPANADDSAFCLILGQHAVHAGLSGRTNMFISYWNNHFVHVPLHMGTLKRKVLDPRSDLWQTLLETTGQMGRCCL